MTQREQEILKASVSWTDKTLTVNEEKAFQAGAKWADKTMIEKACAWITEHADNPYKGEFIDNSPVASDYIEWCKKRLEYAKEIADAFRKAMLEEE